ncbi:hypothetical protein [Singulisphaera sp. PoT]|uniref:hypothetical protein n=1 Tax=Singulisphaera sp. PoT TaxID=3411797 RepID=UPI003BF481A1
MTSNDERDEQMTRRGLMGGMLALGLPILPAKADRPEAGPSSATWGTQPGGLPVFATEIWTDAQWAELTEKPADAKRLEGLGWIRVRDVPRWESLANDPVPQPTPLSEEVVRGPSPPIVIREWRPGDPEHCRLCPGCNATGPDSAGVMTCIRPLDQS